MDNQIDTIMGQHAALAAIENLKRVIISLKCTKEFFEKTIKSKRLLLHAGELKFHDHLSKKNIHIQCKLPADFYQFMINYGLL